LHKIPHILAQNERELKEYTLKYALRLTRAGNCKKLAKIDRDFTHIFKEKTTTIPKWRRFAPAILSGCSYTITI
jgi:hypothetical protein